MDDIKKQKHKNKAEQNLLILILADTINSFLTRNH